MTWRRSFRSKANFKNDNRSQQEGVMCDLVSRCLSTQSQQSADLTFVVGTVFVVRVEHRRPQRADLLLR